MAGTGLSGITSIEEIFLQESQTVAVAAETLQKCGDNADINNGDDTTTSDLQADESEAVNLFAIDMDIGETMGALKARAAEAFNLDLHDYSVLVLSEHELADDNTLQKQCGTESGMVQIQFALRNDSANTRGFIDILDVLKPNEVETVPVPKPQLTLNAVPKPVINDPKSMKTSKTMRWIVCPTFKEVQRVLKIPQDPREWSTTHVRQWLSWAIFQFGLRGINISDNCWTKTGKELFALGQTEFQKLVPDDPANMFYMHFELLRRTNVVAVVCDPNSSTPKPAPPKTNASISFMKSETSQGKSSLDKITTKETTGRGETSSSSVSSGTGTQQIQLWQFLLELLTSPKMYQIISWYGDDGEFRLHQPDVVASLWGQRKSKPNMNYEKLSRALRYYYEGDMIAKVYGKRFVYKFVLDLKSVIGYSASELKRQVFELLLKNKLINTEENITSLADLNEVTFI